MKQNIWIAMLAIFTCLCSACDKEENAWGSGTYDPNGNTGSSTEPKEESAFAFPGADGAGRNATGGRGGTVYKVTSLADTNTKGTLRYAVNRSGARIIVFDVSGIIELTSNLTIKNGDLTIAGQTAPCEGICLKNYALSISANNVIVRYLRVRMGDEMQLEDDAISCRGTDNVMIDHCSASWSTDECVSCYGNTRFTMQYCILSESLTNSVHEKGSHGYGGIWGGQTVSFHHNLLAHHNSRTPRFCGSRYTNRPDLEQVDFCNNVIYNWAGLGGYAGEGGSYNIVNNYYRPGPATYARGGEFAYRIFAPGYDDGTNAQPKGIHGIFYVNGNVMHNNSNCTNDNWTYGIQPDSRNCTDTYSKDSLRAADRFSIASYDSLQTAAQAYERVLASAGASFVRDVVDARIVSEVRAGTYTYTGSNGSTNGIIDTQTDAGGWPTYSQGTVPVDTDSDGMPDDWETANKLNPKNAADAVKYSLSTGYTNIEVYINSLTK